MDRANESLRMMGTYCPHQGSLPSLVADRPMRTVMTCVHPAIKDLSDDSAGFGDHIGDLTRQIFPRRIRGMKRNEARVTKARNASTTGPATSAPPQQPAPPLRTAGRMQRTSQSPSVDDTAFQQGLILLAAGTLAAFVLMRTLSALLRSLPLLALGMYLSRPSFESFVEFLSTSEKIGDINCATKKSSLKAAGTSTASSGVWFKNVIRKTLGKSSEALFTNPVRDWKCLDMGLFVVCKKQKSALEDLSANLTGRLTRYGKHVFAVGMCRQWLLLDPGCLDPGKGEEWPWWKLYAYNAACVCSMRVSDAWWHALPSFAAHERSSRTQATLGTATAAAMAEEALQGIVGGCLDDSRKYGGVDQVDVGVPVRDRRVGMVGNCTPGADGPPMRRHLQAAQALAERGNFQEAGRTVEMGVKDVRGQLRGGSEEEREMWSVASAFYEAGRSSSTCRAGRLRCLGEVARLWVAQERWKKAAELFQECVAACTEAQACARAPALREGPQYALSSVLALAMYGDTLQATAWHTSLCDSHSWYGVTPEAGLAGEILRGLEQHNPRVIQVGVEAYRKQRQGAPSGRALAEWEEGAVMKLMQRADALVLL